MWHEKQHTEHAQTHTLYTLQQSHNAHWAKVSVYFLYHLRYNCGKTTIIRLLQFSQLSPALISQIK